MKEIDWEQRRYEVAKDVLSNATVIHDAFKDKAVNFAIKVADIFIEELKKRQANESNRN